MLADSDSHHNEPNNQNGDVGTMLHAHRLIGQRRPEIEKALEVLRPFMIEAGITQDLETVANKRRRLMNLALSLVADCYRFKGEVDSALDWYRIAGGYWKGGAHVTFYAQLTLAHGRTEYYEDALAGLEENEQVTSRPRIARLRVLTWWISDMICQPWNIPEYFRVRKSRTEMKNELRRRIIEPHG